jgi:hypothetical protein
MEISALSSKTLTQDPEPEVRGAILHNLGLVECRELTR